MVRKRRRPGTIDDADGLDGQVRLSFSLSNTCSGELLESCSEVAITLGQGTHALLDRCHLPCSCLCLPFCTTLLFPCCCLVSPFHAEALFFSHVPGCKGSCPSITATKNCNSLVTTKDDTHENLSMYQCLIPHTHTHTHSLSLVLVVTMKSKELKTKIYSHAHSQILSLMNALTRSQYHTQSLANAFACSH